MILMIKNSHNPVQCPQCHSIDIENEEVYEYTDGGFGDTWVQFFCNCVILNGEVKKNLGLHDLHW